mgnify:CR=1 FL=1
MNFELTVEQRQIRAAGLQPVCNHVEVGRLLWPFRVCHMFSIACLPGRASRDYT